VNPLIVNADDFGLTAGVNRAIVELHAGGVLTSTTLMARAGATAEAVRLARATPTLGVGCHVVLVPANEIPSLIDQRTGRFMPTLGAFLQRLMTGRIRAAEMEAEATAQIAHLQAAGVSLTHIDTHKHVHMFPAVLKPVLRAAAGCGIRSIRNPFEPAWSLRVTPGAPWMRRVEVHLLRQFLPGFRKHVARAGLATTDGAIGVLATGTLDAATVGSLLQNLPPGTWELVTHPGYNDADLAHAHTRLLASRETERDALHELKHFPEIELMSFAGLTANRDSALAL
jgi:predicted glycoside hydrolase/deacetylase ChbG (UPF0249 family)